MNHTDEIQDLVNEIFYRFSSIRSSEAHLTNTELLDKIKESCPTYSSQFVDRSLISAISGALLYKGYEVSSCRFTRYGKQHRGYSIKENFKTFEDHYTRHCEKVFADFRF